MHLFDNVNIFLFTGIYSLVIKLMLGDYLRHTAVSVVKVDTNVVA